ncbi:hypothetical protein N0V88_004437 [Collariella sp. IMI 366227]|nr:hypothetical protein N0V88_004437 [Collariella sp. IMI 366227]
MRILKERCWLAVLALVVGVAKAGNVTFEDGFLGSFGNRTEAIISFEDAQGAGFKWRADGATVNEVKLIRIDTRDPTRDRLIFLWKNQVQEHPNAAISTSNLGATPTAESGSVSATQQLGSVRWRQEDVRSSENITGKEAGNKDTSDDKDGDGKKGGLSSGAVIGIAVACGVIGLAIIFGLVWWFVRRRKQQKELLPMNSAFSSARRTEDLIVQKEANAETDAGPHSPYSDEGAAGTTHGSEALAAGAASSTHQPHAQDQSRSFTPYSDRPSGTGPAVNTPSVRAASLAHTTEEANRTGGMPSPTPGRATPRALSTPYAHLVEEGMTEDEIRRLEDEERQLDAAIEQAGRRPSAV